MSKRKNLNKQKQKTSFNLLLGTGIAFVLLGLVLLVALAVDIELKLTAFRHLIWAILGGGLLFVSLVKLQRKSLIFTGLFLLLNGILFFCIDTKFIPYSLDALWPVTVIIGGFALFASGFYVDRSIRTSQLVPPVSLVLLGVFCLLFSLDIIEEPFWQLASRWWPLVLIAAGFCLVVLFFVWNANKIQLEDVEDDFTDLDDIN
ncbi:MAG: hypothetical protein IKW26_03060 [Treponema sp.]|nr:hypothetical protein [Treponema sp.]